MRTTVDIDDDVLAASRELAVQRRSSIGKVLSDLARPALRAGSITTMSDLGYEVFAKRGLDRPITLAEVNRLRDELP